MANSFVIKMKLNLQNLSMTAFVVKLWQLPAAKEMVREYFENPPTEFCYELEDFTKIIDCMSDRLEKIYLPEKMLVELKALLRYVGEKVFWWTFRVKCDLGLELKYAESVSWTCYGKVDEAKTFQLYWENDPDLLHNQFKNSAYSIACIFGQVDFVSRNFSVMKKILEDYCGPMPEISDTDSLISKWLFCYLKQNVWKENELDRCLNYKHSDSESLFMCATAGYLNAVKYFAKNLNNNKDRHYSRIARKLINKFPWGKRNHILRDSYIEIVIFSINNMSEKARSRLLTERLYYLFYPLVDAWPYEELACQITDYIFPLMEKTEQMMLLITIFKSAFYLDKHPSFTFIAHQTLRKILEFTSQELKKEIFLDTSYSFWNLASFSYGYFFDFPLAKLILNDPDVMIFRDVLIEKGRDVFMSWIKFEDYDVLNQFMHEFVRVEERKKFKSNLNTCLKELVEHKKFEKADKFLDWSTDSAEEKLLIKKGINTVEIFQERLFQMTTSFPDWKKLLNWQFDEDREQMTQVTKILRNKSLFHKEFYKIWGVNCLFSVETSKSKCLEFLNFFFLPHEIESFKRNKIAKNENFLKNFCDNLQLPEHFQTVDEFLKFCSLTEHEIDKIKSKVRANIGSWIALFYKEKKSFKTAFAVVNWAIRDNEKEKEIMGNFINSDRGARLCFDIVKTYNDSFYENAIIFFNLWLKPYGDISKMMEHFSSMSSDEKVKETVYNMEELLDILKSNGVLLKSELDLILL